MTNYNSEKCVSKYGIQDLVGNVMERTADRIFCNFDKRQLWFKKSANVAFSKSTSLLAYSAEMSDELLIPYKLNSFVNLESERAPADGLSSSFRNFLV